mmetsp:Transcript_7103/g.8849  ORF Transcript_7103/g.8849 Transcript_7103/m.8849 type:complete len:117 (+) Transcript_7103:653-1003(+)
MGVLSLSCDISTQYNYTAGCISINIVISYLQDATTTTTKYKQIQNANPPVTVLLESKQNHNLCCCIMFHTINLCSARESFSDNNKYTTKWKLILCRLSHCNTNIQCQYICMLNINN